MDVGNAPRPPEPPPSRPTLAELRPAVHQLSDRLHELASSEVNLFWTAVQHLPLSGAVSEDAETLAVLFEGSSDFLQRPIPLPDGAGVLIWLSSMTSTETVDQLIFGGISRHHPEGKIAERHAVQTFGEAARQVIAGRALLLAPGRPAVALEAAGYQRRALTQPILETVVRGPHEAFNEDLETNVSLVRRRLGDPRLRVESFQAGALSRTEVRLIFIQGLANDSIVNEARRRLRDLGPVHVLDTNYIQEAIEDDPYSIFPQVDFTERPDVVVAGLTEGRFAILAAGTSDALIAPVTFWSFLQAADDYYQRYWIAIFLRWLRFWLLFLALVMPALYIAITTFHQQMLPFALLLTIMRARQDIPFPAVIEAFIMEISLEILREAGLHLPPKLGTSLSVVGALIIGQASVAAGLVSWPVVVIVSVTAIANFAIPRWSMALAVRLLRFTLMVIGAMFGLPGILVGTALILAHLTSLRSFGVPYLFPVAPLDLEGLTNVVSRSPHWAPTRRPRLLAPHWRLRVRPGHRPRPPAHGGTA